MKYCIRSEFMCTNVSLSLNRLQIGQKLASTSRDCPKSLLSTFYRCFSDRKYSPNDFEVFYQVSALSSVKY